MLGTGGSTLGIGLAIHLRDRFTAKAAGVNAAMNRMHKNANAVMTANLGALRNMGLGMAMVGGLGLRQMAGWVKQGSQFEYTMAAVGAVTKALPGDMEKMTQKALKLGGETKFTIQEVADAMKFLGMAGFDPSTINQTVEAVTALGAATDLPISGIGGMADVMTNIMTAFQIAPSQAMRVSDVLVAIATSANTSVAQMGEAYKYSADVFSSLNIPLEESAAMLAMLGNSGLQASIAGTSLGNTWRKVGKAMTSFATKRQLKGMAFLGLDRSQFIDSEGRMKNMTEVIRIFAAAYKKSGKTVEAAGAIEAITAIRGKRGLMPLIRDVKTGKSFDEYVDIAKFKAQNEALRIAGDRLNNLTGDTLIMKSAWSGFTYEFQQALAPLLRILTQALTYLVKALTAFTSTGIGKAVMIGVAAFTLIVTVAGVFAAILGSIGLLLRSSVLSFASMKASAVWAYNAMTASALRYATAARAAAFAGAGAGVGGMASYTKGGVKMLVHGAGGAAAGAAGSIGGGILGGLMSGFKKLLPWVMRLGRFIPGVGLAMMALELIGFSLEDQFSAIGFVLEGLMSGLMSLIETVTFGLISFDYLTDKRAEENARHAAGNAMTFKALGQDNYSKVLGGSGYDPSVYQKQQEQKEYDARGPNSILNVIIDGERTMEHKIQDGGEHNLYTELGSNP